MGNLRDQLKKANLITKKDAKRLAHEERLHRKQVGGAAGVEREQAERAVELARLQESRRESDRGVDIERQKRIAETTEAAACEELLRREVRRPGRRGAARWYFCLADGQLPFLELPLTERMQLQDGTVCIVRVGPVGSHDYGLISSHHGERIATVFTDRVVWAAP